MDPAVNGYQMDKTIKKPNIQRGWGTPDNPDGETRVVVPAEFRELVPAVGEDPRGSVIWNLRIRSAADLNRVRLVLLTAITADRVIVIDRDFAATVVAYCRVDERLSRILGLECQGDDPPALPPGPLFNITFIAAPVEKSGAESVLDAAKEVIRGNGNGKRL